MRFPEETRKRIYASGGKPVEIDWPEGSVLPEPHRTYTVQSSRRAGALKIRVLRSLDDGLRALVQIDGDPPHLLGKSGGYTSRPSHALRARVAPDPADPLQFRPEYEPEALSGPEIAELTRRTRLSRIEQRREQLAELYEAIAKLQDNPDFADSAARLRFMRSLARKIEKEKTREDLRYLADLEEEAS